MPFVEATIKAELVAQLKEELATLDEDPATIRDEGMTAVLAMRRTLDDRN